MFKIPRPHSWPPALDLTTVRDTLDYMREDVARIPGLERIAAALEDALVEIEVVEREQQQKARFIPAKPGQTAQFVSWNPDSFLPPKRLGR